MIDDINTIVSQFFFCQGGNGGDTPSLTQPYHTRKTNDLVPGNYSRNLKNPNSDRAVNWLCFTDISNRFSAQTISDTSANPACE